MGLFNKIKNMFSKDSSKEEKETIVEKNNKDEEKEIEEDTNEEVKEKSKEIKDAEIIDKKEEKVDKKSSKKESYDEDEYDEEEEELEDAYEDDEEEEVPSKKKKEIVDKIDRKSVNVYEKGLTKSREGFVSKLIGLTNKYKKITDEYFDELEEILIMADVGVNTVMSFMDRMRDRVRKEGINSPDELKEIIVDELFIIYVNDQVLSSKIHYREDGPTVILFVGVNGVGKTTTIGKLANKLKSEGKKVLLVGADTFRAGAVAQLDEWAKKIDVGFYGKEEGADPASVVYDGIVKAKEEKYDIVLVDTAGRLQNKVNLMKELEKINRVIDSLITGGADETLLVIDATTGQNGISQAKSFKEITNITGIVLTKLDGTAKGGIVLAIKEEVGVPVKYIGLGEGKDDLQVFDIEKYIYGLFKDMM